MHTNKIEMNRLVDMICDKMSDALQDNNGGLTKTSSQGGSIQQLNSKNLAKNTSSCYC